MFTGHEDLRSCASPISNLVLVNTELPRRLRAGADAIHLLLTREFFDAWGQSTASGHR